MRITDMNQRKSLTDWTELSYLRQLLEIYFGLQNNSFGRWKGKNFIYILKLNKFILFIIIINIFEQIILFNMWIHMMETDVEKFNFEEKRIF